MSVTATKLTTVQSVLDSANPNTLADALRKIALGTMLSVVKVVISGIDAATAVDITTAAVKAHATITGLVLATGQNLPPIGTLIALTVVGSGGGNKPGVYLLTDSAGTAVDAANSPLIGIAKLSDDGKTLTFASQVTALTLIYMPRAAVVPSTESMPFAP